jgi:hypothetical protein
MRIMPDQIGLHERLSDNVRQVGRRAGSFQDTLGHVTQGFR